MYNKITNILLLIVMVLICSLGIATLVNNATSDKEHVLQRKVDSLNIVNNSLQYQINKNDSIIKDLHTITVGLAKKISEQKTKIIYVDKQVEVDKYKIDNLNKKQLAEFFNDRYPIDTVSNKIPLAQPVLTATAKDLVEFDGAKKKLIIKDSIINFNEQSLLVKDEIINKHLQNEDNFKNMIKNQNTEIDLVLKDNKQLKKQNKIQRFIHYTVIGGLVVGLIAK